MNGHVLSLNFSSFFFSSELRGTALPLEHHTDLMLSSRDFFRLIVEGEHLPGDIHSKIFTCIPHRLSWGSRIGGAVLLVGIRRAEEGRMYKTRDRLELDCVVKTKSPRSRMMVRIGVLLWAVCCAVALRRPWLVTEFGMWDRMHALCGKYERRRLMEISVHVQNSLNFNMKIAEFAKSSQTKENRPE